MSIGESVDGEAENGQIDGDIRPIEDGELDRHKFQKIGDMTEPPAVDAIADGSPEQQAKGQAHPETSSALPPDPDDHAESHKQAESSQQR